MIQRSNQVDPLKLSKTFWPGMVLYKEQKEILYSVWDNDETVVPAANMVGKDFIAGLIVVEFFLTRAPCRIITTSATDGHLDILWGEINRFIQNSAVSLISPYGPLSVSHHRIRRIESRKITQGNKSYKVYDGIVDPMSFVRGVVTRPGHAESIQGSHAGEDPFSVREKLEEREKQLDKQRKELMDDMDVKLSFSNTPRTLFVCDEASAVDDDIFTKAKTWAHRILILGNTWRCSNYFFRAVEGDPATGDPGGDILA